MSRPSAIVVSNGTPTPAPPSIEDRIAVPAGGGVDPCEVIDDRLWRRVRGFTAALSHGRLEDAEDLVQDLFARLLRRGSLDAMASRAESADHLRAMIFKAARRHVIDDFRRRQAAKRAGWEFRESFDGRAASVSIRHEPAPDEVLACHELERVADECEDRVAAELVVRGQERLLTSIRIAMEHGPGEVSYADLAGAADLTAGAFRTALSRYRRRFRDLVTEELEAAA